MLVNIHKTKEIWRESLTIYNRSLKCYNIKCVKSDNCSECIFDQPISVEYKVEDLKREGRIRDNE